MKRKNRGMILGLIASLILSSSNMTAFAQGSVSGGDICAAESVSGGDIAVTIGEADSNREKKIDYFFEDPQKRFTVSVTAGEGALPTGAELKAELLQEDSEAYKDAEEALADYLEPMEEYAEELPELADPELVAEEPDAGFIALDIHFEVNGEEIEPLSEVTVCINALGLLPESADPESLELQHHIEESDVVETVADQADATEGVIAVAQNTETEALDITTVFTVDSFSTFTLTWNSGAQKAAQANVHYVDADGNPLFLDGESHVQLNFKSGKAYSVGLFHNGINHDGYTYSGSYFDLNGDKKQLARIGYTADEGGKWAYREWDSDSWTYVLLSDWSDTIDIYMVFQKIQGTVSENDIHENIKMTLYDYGSYIDYGEDKALQFGWHDRKAEAIDGLPLNQEAADGLHILTNRDIINSGLEYSVPKMKKTLNEEGFPELADDARLAAGKSLEYLFRKDGPALYTGAAATPLSDYSRLREEATVYQVTQNNKVYNSYNSHFESMRFDLTGDAGLFYMDEDGYYVYDSSETSAYYNQQTGKFELNSCLIGPSHDGTDLMSLGLAYGMNFMPFDKIDFTKTDRFIPLPGSENKQVYMTPFSETEDLRAEVSNMFFGLTMEIEFYMPKNGQINGDDMVFEFSGDDDVWIYVDDVLMLDIGGTHGRYDGTINFATGEVHDMNLGGSYSAKVRTIKSTFEEAGEATELGFDGDTFSDYTKHTIKFFYLERGGNIGFCRLRFNMPALPEKSLNVSKQLEAYENSEVTTMVKNALTYDFRVLKADTAGNATEELFVKEGDIYTLLKDGVAAGTGTVGAGGYFSLKADEAAQFTDVWNRAEREGVTHYVVEERLPNNVSGTYGAVEYVVGKSVNTIIGESGHEREFTTYQTAALSVDETQFVNYRNKVKTTIPLRITKTETGDEEPARQQLYQLKVWVGSEGDTEDALDLIAVGTEYTVGQTAKTVTEEGIIELAANETAELKMLPGTRFKIAEEINNAYTYYPSYAVDGEACGIESAQGSIDPAQITAAEVMVSNIYYKVPVYYDVTVNYLDGANGERIADSYVSGELLKESAYDVTAQAAIAIEGYTYDRTTGDALSGILDADKVINVYYTKNVYHKVTIHYYDQESGEKIAESFVSEEQLKGSSYDVSEKIVTTIDGYTYVNTVGDALSGILDADKVISVNFVKNPVQDNDQNNNQDNDQNNNQNNNQNNSQNDSQENDQDSGDNETYLEDPQVPLGMLVILEDEMIPLAGAPATGDEAPLGLMAAVLAAASVAVVLLLKRRR